MRGCKCLPVVVAIVLVLVLGGCGPTRRSVAIEPGSPGPYGRSIGGRRPVAHGDAYRVARGDTLYGIAFRNGLDFRALAAWNDIDPPYVIHPGQRLRLSPPDTRHRRTPPPPRVVARAPRPSPVVVAGPPPVAPMRPAPSANAGPARTSGGVAWRWPTDGRLVSRFDPGDAIPGIELAGDAGQPVRAAADGVVVYSGNGLVGYGELIIIKHTDSLLSAYGHNRKRLVKEGERVAAGQLIAEMGSTGAPRNELEFQIRRDGNPVDPLQYLPAR